MLDALDADAVRRWSRTALESMRAHQVEIDALNVFPVPDSDTGTNLLLTLLVADDAVRSGTTDSAGAVLADLARAAVLGARGNSGVIVSQILRGFAEAAADAVDVDADTFCAGLRRGAELADAAVAQPVEGTILTVAHAAASAVPDAGDKSLATCVTSAVVAAEAALAHTREQLPALTEAGVVDAGGRGYVVLLDALAEVLTGSTQSSPKQPPAAVAPAVARESGSLEFAYEVQYLLDADPAAVDDLRAHLVELGDSVAVVGTGDGTWNVHVHVNDVGAALEAGMTAGRPHRVSVARFADQIQPAHRADGAVAIVAVSPGAGLSHLFAREGVDVVATGDPSADDVLTAVRRTGGHAAVVLANGARAIGAAETAAGLARQDGVRMAVVPTRSPVQALAAVAVYDPSRSFDDVVVSMAEAAAATRFAEVVIAAEQALTAVGICEAGDVLGLIDGEVVEIGAGLLAVVLAIVDRLLGIGGELLTVVVGGDAPRGLGDLVTGHVRDRARFTDVAVYAADQSDYPVIIGME